MEGRAARIPELDGLRGGAVLAVIASHYAYTRLAPVLELGWAGVDLFFVLSGFLITGILRRTRTAEAYYGPFWKRRARRIWPLAFGVLAVYYGAAWLVAPSLLSQPFWIVFFLALQSVFAPALPADAPLWMRHYAGIAWSLSVEECFYVIWAPIVRLMERRGLFLLCALLIVGSPAIRFVIHRPTFPEYFLLVARADSLAWGAAAALLLEDGTFATTFRRRRQMAVAAAIASVLLMLVWTGGMNRSLVTTAVLGYSVIDASAAVALLSLVVSSGTTFRAAQIARWGWLRYAGLVSYGMYMFHMPIFDLTRFLLSSDSRSTRVVALAVTAGVASLSWWYLEMPILNAGLRRPMLSSRPPAAQRTVQPLS